MAFNSLISNTDDHPRNHALLAPTEKWELLSPAYDLTPNPLVSQEKRDLAMTCGRFNRYANRANLLSQHAQFKLSLDRARAIVDQVQIAIGSLDHPERVRIDDHVWTRQQLRWFHVDDRLPRFPTSSTAVPTKAQG